MSNAQNQTREESLQFKVTMVAKVYNYDCDGDDVKTEENHVILCLPTVQDKGESVGLGAFRKLSHLRIQIQKATDRHKE